MEIEFNPGLKANAGINPPTVRREIKTSGEKTMPFERTPALEKSFQEAPVRPEIVSRANALVADQNYPPDELLNKIAGVLANHLNEDSD